MWYRYFIDTDIDFKVINIDSKYEDTTTKCIPNISHPNISPQNVFKNLYKLVVCIKDFTVFSNQK